MSGYRYCKIHGAYFNVHGCPLCQVCEDCGTTGHSAGSNTCGGPEQEKLELLPDESE